MFRLPGLFTLTLILSACGAQSNAPGPHATPDGKLSYGQLTFKPCSLSMARVAAVEAQCATLPVP
jgi:hypothetical protein